MSSSRVSISQIEGTTLHHALLGNETMRVRLSPSKDGGLRVSRFHARRNLKIRDYVLTPQEHEHYLAKSVEDRVRFLFAHLT
jgi:hypothetical protein